MTTLKNIPNEVLLYTDEKQDFDKAMNIFSEINVI